MNPAETLLVLECRSSFLSSPHDRVIIYQIQRKKKMLCIPLVCAFRSGVGISGSLHTVYYAEVTDAMKVDGYGGGNEHEGELIDVYELPVASARDFVMDEDISKPVSLMFAFMWFFEAQPHKK